MWSFIVLVSAIAALPLLLCMPVQVKVTGSEYIADDRDGTYETGSEYITDEGHGVYETESRKGVIYIENKSNPWTCNHVDVAKWSYSFRVCFITRKLDDIEWQLKNTVDRIVGHAENCVINYYLPCRPNYDGFNTMMNEVVDQLQNYFKSFLLEMDYKGKEKIKDLDCIETLLSNYINGNCFEPVFDSFPSQEDFIGKIKRAISCTDELNKLCSKPKKSLDKMSETILGVTQSEMQNFQDSSSTSLSPSSSSSNPPSPTFSSTFPNDSPSTPSSSPPAPSSSPPTSSTSLSPSPPTPSTSRSPFPPTPSTPTPSTSPPPSHPTPSSSTPPHPSTISSTSLSNFSHLHQHYTTKPPLPPPPPVTSFTSRAIYFPFRGNRQRTTTTTTTPPPVTWRWYDYIIQPVISAWNWFKSLF